MRLSWTWLGVRHAFEGANIFGACYPEGFREGALANGAVEFQEDDDSPDFRSPFHEK